MNVRKSLIQFNKETGVTVMYCRLIINSIAMIILLSGSAISQRESQAGDPNISPELSVTDHPGYADDYPGWAHDGSKAMDVGQFIYCNALQQYYMLFGHWPSSWDDVTREKIVQVPIVGFNNENTNSADYSLDSYGDLVYDQKVLENGNIQVFELRFAMGPSISRIEVPKPVSYGEWFEALSESHDDRFIEYLHNPQQMKLFSAVGQLRHAAFLYWQVYGSYPCTLADLLESGLAPYDEQSINPASGDPFIGMGGANDIYYEWINDGTAIIEPVQADGSRWGFHFTL